jgi:DtxR family manganese transport transcriptional regulator
MDDRSDPLVMREARRQARSFEKVREAHQREVAEDYVELIADLIASSGEARVVDLAERLGVTSATVNNTLQRLVAQGLVRKERYRSIFLTDEGRAMAEESRHRHRLVVDLLMRLGVEREAAETDAEGVEHHISRHTLSAIERFLNDE